MTKVEVLDDVVEAISGDRSGSDRARMVANLIALQRKMAQFGNRRNDPVRMIQSYLGDRWSSLIMHLLSGGMLRHVELRRLICALSAEHDISQRVLTLKLKVLERDGIVLRTVTTDVPPRVEYALSTLGLAAYDHFASLVSWAEEASIPIRAARESYDLEHPDSAALFEHDDDNARN